MKLSRLGAVALGMYCSLTFAEGGNHTQGVLLCGTPFDNYNIIKQPLGTCVFETFKYKNAAGRTFWSSVDPNTGLRFSFKTLTCTQPKRRDGKPFMYQICTTDKPVCGSQASIGVMPGTFVTFPAQWKLDPNATTAFCAIPVPPVNPPPSYPEDYPEGDGKLLNGAVGKCIEPTWFDLAPVEGDQLSEKQFRACLVMARAVYDSIFGTTQTQEGVWVEVGTRYIEEHSAAKCNLRTACFEATWNENGPVCVSRKRKDAFVALFEKQVKEWTALAEANPDASQNDAIRSAIAKRNAWLGALKDPKTDDKMCKKILKHESGVIYNRSRRELNKKPCDPTDYDIPKCKPGEDPLPWDPGP